MIRKRTATSGGVHTSLPTGVLAPLSGVLETIGGMGTDLRGILRIRYLRMFAYTAVTSFVLLAGSVLVYDEILEPAFGVYDLFTPEADLLLFATIASVPMINCGRLLFVARISGRRATDTFTPRSLLRSHGIEIAILIAIVPFLSKEIFEATGLPNVLRTLTPLADFLFGPGSIQDVQQVAIIVTVLYLYPSIILVYLSHSKLSKLYPFTQFLAIARSWSYALLVATTVPVVLLNLQILDIIDRNLYISDVVFVDPLISDVLFMAVFVVLSTVTFQFVFVRLGSIVVTDERMREIFTGEVDKEIQTTLSEFS